MRSLIFKLFVDFEFRVWTTPCQLHQVNTVNTLVLTVAVLLTFALVAPGAPASASAQYLGGEDQVSVDDLEGHVFGSPQPYSGAILSPIPFITFLILGIVASGIAAAFFIKGRSGGHAAMGNG